MVRLPQVRHGGPLNSCGSSLLAGGGEYIIFGTSADLAIQAQDDTIEDPPPRVVQQLERLCEGAMSDGSGAEPTMAVAVSAAAGLHGPHHALRIMTVGCVLSLLAACAM